MNLLGKQAILFLLGTLLSLGATGKVNMRLALDRNVLPADKKNTAIVQVSLIAGEHTDKQARIPVNLAIVLDRSESMKGRKLDDAKLAALQAIASLGPHDRVALITYADTVETLISSRPVPLDSDATRLIKDVQPRGGTALFGGVSLAAAELRKHINRLRMHRVVLISDGIANQGPSSARDLERLGRALMKEDISVSTIGIGDNFNEDLMTRLSLASDGNAYFLPQSKDLSRVLQREITEMTQVAATDVDVQVRCLKGVRPLRIIGLDGSIKDGDCEVRFNQLYHNTERYVLVEVAVSPTKARSSLPLVEAKATLLPTNDDKRTVASGTIYATFSEKEKDVIAGVDRDVQTMVALNKASTILDMSVEFMDKGSKGQAVSNLNDFARDLRSTGNYYQNRSLVRQAEKIDLQAETIKNKGMDARRRKVWRTNSINLRQQQTHLDENYKQLFIKPDDETKVEDKE